MRLWHQALLPILDGPRLLDTHMSCCNLRGLGWGKKNSAVDYVFKDPRGEDALAVYHNAVLREMQDRGYNFDKQWYDFKYCGKRRPLRDANVELCIAMLPLQVALAGHTEDIFLSDVQALVDRRGDIQLDPYPILSGQRSWLVSSRGKEVVYTP